MSGRDLAQRLFRLALAIRYPGAQYKIKQLRRNGRYLLVYINEHACRRIAINMFQGSETRFIHMHLKEDDICFDVGAHVGYFTNIFASIAREGHVVAVEPLVQNALLIELTAAINQDHHVEVVRGAAGSAPGSLELRRVSESGFSAVAPNMSGSIRRSLGGERAITNVTVPAVTVDSLAKEYERVDILKIDVEGFEFEVLRGAESLLLDTNRRPRLLMIELVDAYLAEHGASVGIVSDWLRERGYEPMVLVKGELARFVPDLHAREANLWFVPRVC